MRGRQGGLMMRKRVSLIDQSSGLWRRVVWLDQQLRLQNQNEDKKVTREFVEKECGVGPRTAYDTVAFLRDQLKAPIRYCKKRKHYVYDDETYFLPSLILTERQIEGLLLLQQAAAMLPDDQRTVVTEMVDLLVRTLPVEVQGVVSAQARRTHVATPPRGPSPGPRVMSALEFGLRERRLVDIIYRTLRRDEETQRAIEPHFLSVVDGSWHLVAFDHLSGSPRVFNVSRIRHAKVQPNSFMPRPELSPECYEQGRFRSDFGHDPFEVKLRVDEWQSRWFRERPVHPTQQLDEQPDGGVILRFTTSGKNDLVRWLLGYADHVEVLEPAWLRETLVDRIRRMGATYGLGL